MSDLRRLQEDASTAASAGDWTTAARLYATLEKGAPGDGTWPLRLGECLRKLGKPDEALTALTRSLKVYSRQHMRNKAVAVCRLMLEMDPRNPQIPAVIEWLSSEQEDEPKPQPEPNPQPAANTPIHTAETSESGAFQLPSSMRKAERHSQRDAESASAASAPVASSPPPSAPGKPLQRVVMPRTPFFSAMNDHQLRMVNERACLLELEPGQILYALGDPANALFLVATGRIAVLLPQEVGRLHRGDFFGEEVVVLPGQPRMATTRAVEASQVLALEKALVDNLIAETPALLEILAQNLREHLVSRLGATSPMVATLGKPERDELMARFHFREAEMGSQLYQSTDPEAGLFILLAGEAMASLDDRLTERLQPGDIFGEIGLVTNRAVRAVATASSKCFVLCLPRAEFAALGEHHPQVAAYLAALADSRLDRLKRNAEARLSSSQSIPIPPRVFLLHGDTVTLHVYEGALSAAGFIVDSASQADKALGLLANERFDVVLCNLDFLTHSAVDLLGEIRQRDLDVPIILTTGDDSVDTAGAAASHSVVQTFLEPVALPEVLSAASRAAQFHRLTRLRRQAMARHNPSGEWMGDQTGLEHQFRGALDRLWMAFQPIISSSAGDVVAFEALLRSKDELLRSPIAVFRAAERLNRVHDVGRIIRDKVATTVAEAANPPIVCINIHSQDLLDSHLLDPESPLSAIASRIILELTERTPLDDLTDLRARLAALRALGYRFALDDLGAGHAGVATLAQLEPDLAKLDISLIRGIDSDPDKQDLVRCMLDACRDMKVQVICEGVETRLELDVLVDLGADLMQGYLFAKPGPAFPSVDLSMLARRK